MAEIKITQGYTAIVDDEDFDYLSQFNWVSSVDKNKVYVRRFVGMENGKPKRIYLHREIMKVYDKTILVDHIDGNPLNNKRENLRIATYSQNNKNKISRPGSSSKYIGVSLCKSAKIRKWLSQININGTNVNLGRFETENQAAEAYNREAKIHYKEFARLNIID